MKKYAFCVLILVILVSAPFTVFAQDEGMISPTPTATLNSATKVEYALPYPGMLPDNPLYFMKAFRDRIIGMLINDPLKKAQFNLLTSDKRLNAAQSLLAAGKTQDVVSVVSKSNNYFELGLESAATAQKAGENTRNTLLGMQTAGLKHYEIVLGMSKRVDKQYRSQIKKELDRISQFNKTISKLLKSSK